MLKITTILFIVLFFSAANFAFDPNLRQNFLLLIGSLFRPLFQLFYKNVLENGSYSKSNILFEDRLQKAIKTLTKGKIKASNPEEQLLRLSKEVDEVMVNLKQFSNTFFRTSILKILHTVLLEQIRNLDRSSVLENVYKTADCIVFGLANPVFF